MLCSVPATDLNELQSEISEKENQIYRLTVLVENSQKEMDAIGDIMVCDDVIVLYCSYLFVVE